MTTSRNIFTLTQLQRRIVRVFNRRVHHAYSKLRQKKPVHLLHIGKTGGSTVYHTLRPLRGKTPYELFDHPHKIQLKHVPEGEKVVFFLRDPAKRFVSGFYSRQRQGGKLYPAPWSPLEEAAFTRFATPNELACALSSDDGETRQAAEKAMQNIGHVRTSLSFWLGNETYLQSRLDDLFLIGFQETLAKDLETLLRKLQIKRGRVLPQSNVLAHVAPSHLDKTLSDEAKRNLRIWYREDYDLFELCCELKPVINGTAPYQGAAHPDSTLTAPVSTRPERFADSAYKLARRTRPVKQKSSNHTYTDR